MRITRQWVWFVALVVCSSCGEATAEQGDIVTTEIVVGDMRFNARAAGPTDGELVLLLHGFPQTSYEWRAQLSALAEAGYRAVAPDQRGYSEGARPTEVADYAVPFLTQDVLGMADELGAQRFHIVGHDWGAVIAWTIATLVPARIITHTAVSIPHPDAFSRELADMESCQYSASAYFDFFSAPGSEENFLANDATFLRTLYAGLSEDAVDEYLRVLGTEEALGAALNWYRANIDDRQVSDTAVGSTTVPTLFIWSDQDAAVCREGAEATEELVDAPYRFEVLEGVSHWVPELAAGDVSRFLLEHLAQ